MHILYGTKTHNLCNFQNRVSYQNIYRTICTVFCGSKKNDFDNIRNFTLEDIIVYDA